MSGRTPLLIDVLRHPAKAFSIALPFQHTAHEHFQRPGVQLLQRHTALEERRAVSPGFHGMKVLLPAYCRFSFRTHEAFSYSIVMMWPMSGKDVSLGHAKEYNNHPSADARLCF